MQRIGFITGKLAEASLRQTVQKIAAQCEFEPVVVVAKISVAALMTTSWLRGKIHFPSAVDRVVLPGWCQGELTALESELGAPVVRGPKDLRDLPEFFGQGAPEEHYGDFDIQLIAEINHANRLPLDRLLQESEKLVQDGADIVDLGCTPGESWTAIDVAVQTLRQSGIRTSVDTFDAEEALRGARSGAELILSVHTGNRSAAVDFGCEVVVVPHRLDDGWLDSIAETSDFLNRNGVPHRLDPILEPIGVGFAASLNRYFRTREAFPDAQMLMGIGNLTELTAADTTGVNALLIGYCQELAIRSVLTTQVAHWASGCVRETDVARRLMKFAVDRQIPPKRVDDRLVILRSGKPIEWSETELREFADAIRDKNVRLFANGGRITAICRGGMIEDEDAFRLFRKLRIEDSDHAFYLGWEMMKAALSIQLGKRYVQDNALEWGLLTVEERSGRHFDSQNEGTNPSE